MPDDPSMRAILGWLEDPQDRTGIHFSRRDDWLFRSYASLAGQARQVAWRLREQGIHPGGISLVIQGTSPEFVAAFFGSLLAGLTPAPIAPKAAFGAGGDYAGFLSRILRITQAGVILAEPESARAARAVTEAAGCVFDDARAGHEPRYQGFDGPADLAFLQFSSGSHGFPRAVRVTYSALAADVAALKDWLQADPAVDSMASWLPLHHDMGLVGCCLGPVMHGASLRLIRPEEFIRSPLRWLRCFGQDGATFGACPNFGLRHIVRRIRPAMLDGMDFSPWRALIVGAERVDPRTIEELTRLLGPAGLSPKAVAPAYGMAETALAVTAAPLSEDVRMVRVDTTRLVPGEPVRIDADAVPGSCVKLVSCGRSLRGIDVCIVGDDGQPLPEGVFGQIRVSGSVVADGYLCAGQDAHPVRFGGVIATGDAGFLLDGELYVVGRTGDSIKWLGRWLYAEDIEQIVASVLPAASRPVVLLGSLADASTALVLVDRRAAGLAAEAGRTIADTFAKLRTLVVMVRPGEILRTTSGKPRRSLTWQSLIAGGLTERVVWDSAPDTAAVSTGPGI